MRLARASAACDASTALRGGSNSGHEAIVVRRTLALCLRPGGAVAAERRAAGADRLRRAGPGLVLLVNASKGKPEGPEFHHEFLEDIRHAIDGVTSWPDVDYFDRVGK